MDELKLKTYAVALINDQFRGKGSVRRLVNNMWFAKYHIKNVKDEFDAYYFCSQSDLSFLKYDFNEDWDLEEMKEISRAAFEILKEKNNPITHLFNENLMHIIFAVKVTSAS